MKRVILTMLVCGLTLPARALPPSEAAAWRADLEHFATELPQRHKNAFHTTKREDFEAALATLHERVPFLDRSGVVVELARLVAMVGDGHTGIADFFHDPRVGFGHYPIALYLFDDGLHVYAASPPYTGIVGGRMSAIGGVPIEAALERLRPLIWRDNDSGFKDAVGAWAVTPEVLRHLGLVDDSLSARYTISVEGESRTVEIRPLREERPRGLGRSLQVPEGWVAAAPPAAPLWLRRARDYYWLEYLPETKTLYVQFSEVANKEGEPLSAFADRVAAEAADPRVERMVLDLRWNTGGNNYLNKPLLLAIIKSRVNQRGKLFTLIGRRTFSAAQNLVNDLEKYTSTIFVGEPTAERVNFYADASRIVLPNSGLTIRASALWWQDMDPRDRRDATGPQVAAELTWDDYRRGADPALEAALEWEPSPPLVDQIEATLRGGEADRAHRLAREFVEDRANRYVSIEAALNGLGYRLLGEGRLRDAIEVFRMNVALYPASANVYDSLGEAYAEAGETALALANYRRVLELDPANGSAADMIRRLSQE